MISSEESVRKLRIINNNLIKIISECIRCDSRLKAPREEDDAQFVPGMKVDCCSLSGLLRNTIEMYFDTFNQDIKEKVSENQEIHNLGCVFGVKELSWRIMDFFERTKSFCCSKEKVHEDCSCLGLLNELNNTRPPHDDENK